MTTYICNAFASQMLPREQSVEVYFEMLTLEEVRAILQAHSFESAVGHEPTAVVLTELLGVEVRFHRQSIYLQESDQLIVSELVVPRLPEGKILSREEMQSIHVVFRRVTLRVL